jgi:hypothetical protein
MNITSINGREALSGGDHVAGERCRTSAAVLCRPGRLHARRRLFAERRVRVVQLTPPGSNGSIRIGLTDGSAVSLRNVHVVVTDLKAARIHLLERGVKVVRFDTRLPLMPGTGVSRPRSTPCAGTTPASPTSRTQMATGGCYRNGITAMCDVLRKLRDIERARRSRRPQQEIRTDAPVLLSRLRIGATPRQRPECVRTS